MGKKNVAKIVILGDTKSIEKSLENTAKRLNRTTKSSKKTKKEIHDLGQVMTRSANNVAIFRGQLDPISGRLSAIGTGITRFGLGAVAMGVGVGIAGLAVGNMVSGLESWEQRQNKFNAQLQATSFAARLTAADLEELAQTTARATLGDVAGTADAIIALTSFRNLQKDVFKQTIALAADAKIAFGGNLREGVIAFGKALNDPIANLGALSRKGIQFTDTQEAMIQKFVETGQLIKAQELILAELGDQFGGLATKEAPALAAAMDSLGQSVDNMFESLGRTDAIKGIRDVTAQIVRGADRTAQAIADTHSVRAVELRDTDELSKANEKAYKAWMRAENELQRVLEVRRNASAGFKENYEIELKNLNSLVIKQKASYVTAEKDLNAHIAKKKAARDAEQALFKQGVIKSLNTELEGLEGQASELAKKMEKRRVQLLSSFEDERAKVARVFKAKTKDYKESFDKQLAIVDSSAKKQLEIFEKSKASKKHIDEFIAESDQRKIELKKQYSADLVLVEEGRLNKLQKLDDRDAARELAAENRIIRATEKAARKIKQAAAKKLSIENAMKRAAKDAASDFETDIDIGFKDVEDSAGGTQDFFGINVDESANKFAVLEEQLSTHLSKISAMNITSTDKAARLAAVAKEYTLAQAELERDGKKRAVGDTWDAIATLGASGNKKLFILAKAAAIAKATMSTYEAATNAFAQVPYPFNYAASATIAAAGFVNVRNIASQAMPQFHDGITDVPREGSYLLAQGERVLSKQLNEDLKLDLKNRRDNPVNSQAVAINLTLPDTGSYSATDQWYQDNRDNLVNDVRYAMSQLA